MADRRPPLHEVPPAEDYELAAKSLDRVLTAISDAQTNLRRCAELSSMGSGPVAVNDEFKKAHEALLAGHAVLHQILEIGKAVLEG